MLLLSDHNLGITRRNGLPKLSKSIDESERTQQRNETFLKSGETLRILCFLCIVCFRRITSRFWEKQNFLDEPSQQIKRRKELLNEILITA